MGVHTVGKASVENSGYEGHWSDAKHSGIFDNSYYKQMLNRGWGPELAVNNNTDKNQWQIIDMDAMNEHKQFMLTSDLCLVYNSNKLYDRCRVKYPRTDNRSETAVKKLECNVNMIDEYTDLDPNVHPVCCAWASVWSQRRIGQSELANGDYEFCGETHTQKGKKPNAGKCCKYAKRNCNNCDNKDFP